MTNQLNVNAVLEELKTQDIKDYQLMDMVKSAVQSGIHGLYIADKELILSDTIENSITATTANIIKLYDGIDNAITHHIFEGLNHYIWQREDKKDMLNFHVADMGKPEMLYLVEYAITGTMKHNDGIQAHDILKDAEINTIWSSAGKVEVLGVSVQFYKNGSCKVKGLTTEQKDRIKSGFATFDKYRNVR